MKVLLLIGLLVGYALVLHAEDQNGVSSHEINASFSPDAQSMPEDHPAGEMNVSMSTETADTGLWTGLKLDQELSRPEPFKTGPAPRLYSAIALVYDKETQRPLYKKNITTRASIASITKLMTAMVILDALQPLNEMISIEESDIDRVKRTPSRLAVGTTLTRNELLSLALMASENRAASALARSYPGGKTSIVEAMNAKAIELGMERTHFIDPIGLSGDNVSTAQDLVKMVSAAREYALIHRYTTASSNSVDIDDGHVMRFINTNPLVRNVGWNIGISKTGFINEAGKCLVMEAEISQRSVIIVLLNSWGRQTRIGDANRIKRWMESAEIRSRNSQHS